MEEQKLRRIAKSAEDAASKKIAKVRGEQEALLKGLTAQQQRMERGAMLVEAYSDEVDKVCLVINSALANGMAWEDIDAMVKVETSAGTHTLSPSLD